MTYGNWVEIAYWWSQVALLPVVGTGAYFAWRQLHSIAQQSQATFLLELDKRFESVELAPGRKLWAQLRKETDAELIKLLEANPEVNRDQKYGELFSNKLIALRESKTDDYLSLVRVLGFFETVGVTVKNKYITIENVDRLLHGPILQLELCFGTHIALRQKEMGTPAGMYEHALSLPKAIQAIKKSS